MFVPAKSFRMLGVVVTLTVLAGCVPNACAGFGPLTESCRQDVKDAEAGHAQAQYTLGGNFQ